MGYRIKSVTRKNGPQWKLQFISYKKADAVNPDSGQPEKIKDIPRQDWSQHGFGDEMSLDQAKAKAKSLNAQNEIKRWGEKKAKIRARLDKDDAVECAFLPGHFVKEFEHEVLFEKMSRGDLDAKDRNSTDSHWRKCKKIIRELSLEPKDWNDKAFKFYNLFIKLKMSPSYVQKILRILNQWGYFISKHESKPFLPFPSPRGIDAQKIADAFYDNTPSGEGEASDPLTPEMLAGTKGRLNEPNYNWLMLSVWFGLRPEEIDGFAEPKNWKITVNKKGRKLLHVYQPKLIRVPRPQRWKIIPVKLKQQVEALAIVEQSAPLKRPIYKVMHKWFGTGATLYGGRKNFTDLMPEKGEDFMEISMWMGHRTLDRTYRDYKDRLKTSYEDAG